MKRTWWLSTLGGLTSDSRHDLVLHISEEDPAQYPVYVSDKFMCTILDDFALCSCSEKVYRKNLVVVSYSPDNMLEAQFRAVAAYERSKGAQL